MATRRVLTAPLRGGFKFVELTGEQRARDYVRVRRVIKVGRAAPRRRRFWIEKKPEAPPPPPPPVDNWRVTVGINYVLHRDYRSAIVQRFFGSEDEARDNIEEMEAELEAVLTKELGYGPADWWFSGEANVEVERVPFAGPSVSSQMLQDLTSGETKAFKARELKLFAIKMIEDGVWFKPSTLDRWRGVLGEEFPS